MEMEQMLHLVRPSLGGRKADGTGGGWRDREAAEGCVEVQGLAHSVREPAGCTLSTGARGGCRAGSVSPRYGLLVLPGGLLSGAGP